MYVCLAFWRELGNSVLQLNTVYVPWKNPAQTRGPGISFKPDILPCDESDFKRVRQNPTTTTTTTQRHYNTTATGKVIHNTVAATTPRRETK